MKEELYIYDGKGGRAYVDLSTPSGITLKWVSNMFNSLDKVNCSYSYTFKIPMTNHNRKVMEYAEDIRHKSDLTKKKLKAEYIINGVTILQNAFIYIEKVSDKSYSCVFTWDVIQGLQDLKDNGCSLNELRDALIKKGHENDELIKSDGIVDWYVNWLRNADITKAYSNTTKILCPYYGVYPSDPNYCKYPDFKYVVEQGFPRPAMPIKYLINTINEAFGANFVIGENKSSLSQLPIEPISKWLMEGENIVTYGVLPLVGSDLTDGQLEAMDRTMKCISADLIVKNIMFKTTGVFGTSRALLFEKKPDFDETWMPYEDGIGYLFCKAYDASGKAIGWDFPSNIEDLEKKVSSSFNAYVDPKYGCAGIIARYGCTIMMQTKFYIDLTWFTKLTQEIYDNVKLVVHSWKTNNYGYSDENIEKFEVASFSATSIETVLGDDGMKRSRLHFNFMESEGYESASFCSDNEAITGTEAQYYWFSISASLFEIKDVVFEENFTFSAEVNNLDEKPHKMDSFTNLPDIDCLSFMKSLFYIIGGFPYINNLGEIRIKRYEEIKNNLARGFVYDWSSKVLKQGHTYEELTFKLSDFKQNNYYLSKWDDLDRTESDLKDEDDLYEDGIGNITCDNETLDDEQTVHQLPFYPPFIFDRTNPGTTDETIKATRYSPSDTNLSVDDRGRIVDSNKPKYIDVKPAYGYIHRIPYFDKQKTDRIKSWEENYSLADYYRMSVLNPFKDILMNPSYRYFQQIVENPICITENLLLNEFDLNDIDYAKPIYLEKYNSFFSIITIQRNKDGVSKCELVKLPIYKPPVKISIGIETSLAKFIHFKLASTSSEEKEITLGYIIKNDNDGEYVQHSKVKISGDTWMQFNPTSNTNWVIKDVWLDHYEKGDYNDYEFEII